MSATPPRDPPKPQPFPADPTAKVVSLAEVKAARPGRKPVRNVIARDHEALWPGYLYRSAYTILSGIGGVGKTTLGCDLIARATRGGPFPASDEKFDPINCLIWASEDTEETFLERLQAAGADLSRIWIDSEVPPISELEAQMTEDSIGLVFIETLDLHLPSSIKGNDNTHVRQALQPLIRTLKKLRVCGLVVKHWNKNSDAAGQGRVAGAGAYVHAARVALSVAMDASRVRFLTVDKCNLMRERPPLKFALTDGPIDWLGYDQVAVPGVRPVMADAIEFLRTLLADGPLPAKAVMAAARGAAISAYSLTEAKVWLNIRPFKTGFGKTGEWRWELPLIADDGPAISDLRTLGKEPGEWDPSNS